MAKKRRDDESAREIAARLQREQAAAERRRTMLLLGGAGVLSIGLIAGSVVWVQNQRELADPTAIEGLVTADFVPNEHVTDTVAYEQTPPMGGKHFGNWLNCGVYNQPVVNEFAVHSLEHGAVWVTYDPSIPQADIDALTKRATNEPYMLVSPYEGLPTPVVASAWGRQVQLDGVNDPRLERFLRSFLNGPQTPEPGAVCFGGVDGEGKVR